MRRILFAIPVFMLLLAGCTGAANKELVEPSESGSAIVVEDGEGGQTTIRVTNETGAVYGQVLTDAGFGLPDARVTVIGADHGATTNQTGWFQIQEIPPGKRLVRAEHANYRAAESEIVVESGKAKRLTITLVPPVDGEAGYRPHVHDYWADRTEVTVADADFEMFRPYAAGPYGQAYAYFEKVFYAAASQPCITSDRKGLSGASREFWFDDPNQIVWPGTARIDITLTWTAQDYVPGDMLSVVWRPANSTLWNWGQGVKSGQIFSIPVDPAMADSGHQTFTMWQFAACTWAKGQSGTVANYVQAGKVFPGKFHAKIALVRGGELLLEPPHPRFWANGSSVRILDTNQSLSCVNSASTCFNAAFGKGRLSEPQVFRKSPSALIPPGTGQILLNLSWSYSPTGNVPLGIAYSPANTALREKDAMNGYAKAPVVSQTSTSRSYSIEPKPQETDSFYQAISNWAFLWGEEGKELQYEYTHGCGPCALSLRLTVDVLYKPSS